VSSLTVYEGGPIPVNPLEGNKNSLQGKKESSIGQTYQKKGRFLQLNFDPICALLLVVLQK
jgi:hypothetical protein